MSGGDGVVVEVAGGGGTVGRWRWCIQRGGRGGRGNIHRSPEAGGRGGWRGLEEDDPEEVIRGVVVGGGVVGAVVVGFSPAVDIIVGARVDGLS